MRPPTDTSDSFAAITEKIAILEHALTELTADVAAWPDTDHGLRCEPVDGTADPDALAATAAAHLGSARDALRRLDNAVSTAWAAAARLYLTDPAEQR